MKESYVQKKVLEFAKGKGVEYTKLTGRVGDTDYLFFIPGGKPLVIEFKRPGEVPRKIQQYRIDKLTEWGYNVQVVDNIKTGRGIITLALESSGISKEGS